MEGDANAYLEMEAGGGAKTRGVVNTGADGHWRNKKETSGQVLIAGNEKDSASGEDITVETRHIIDVKHPFIESTTSSTATGIRVPRRKLVQVVLNLLMVNPESSSPIPYHEEVVLSTLYAHSTTGRR